MSTPTFRTSHATDRTTIQWWFPRDKRIVISTLGSFAAGAAAAAWAVDGLVSTIGLASLAAIGAVATARSFLHKHRVDITPTELWIGDRPVLRANIERIDVLGKRVLPMHGDPFVQWSVRAKLLADATTHVATFVDQYAAEYFADLLGSKLGFTERGSTVMPDTQLPQAIARISKDRETE